MADDDDDDTEKITSKAHKKKAGEFKHEKVKNMLMVYEMKLNIQCSNSMRDCIKFFLV